MPPKYSQTKHLKNKARTCCLRLRTCYDYGCDPSSMRRCTCHIIQQNLRQYTHDKHTQSCVHRLHVHWLHRLHVHCQCAYQLHVHRQCVHRLHVHAPMHAIHTFFLSRTPRSSRRTSAILAAATTNIAKDLTGKACE